MQFQLCILLLELSATITTILAGNGYIGCYVDNEPQRTLPNNMIQSTHMTTELCLNHCKKNGFSFAGTQAATWCCCGNTKPTVKIADEKCAHDCSGDRSQKCGGAWKNTVYNAITGLNIGCFEDGINKILPNFFIESNSMTNEMCVSHCNEEGFSFAGTQAGSHCYCGNTKPKFSVRVNPYECNKGCSGDTSQKCGGGQRSSVYEANTERWTIGSLLPTYMGSWGNWARAIETCGPGSFVSGFRLKIEPHQGGGFPCCGTDDTSLNAIEFICSSPDPRDKTKKIIKSSEGPWGNWHLWNTCDPGQFINEVSLRYERNQGSGDDWAATNLRVKCTTGEIMKGPEVKETSYGYWYDFKKCPEHMVVCGLRTKVEPSQGNGDDTALNNVEIQCCIPVF